MINVYNFHFVFFKLYRFLIVFKISAQSSVCDLLDVIKCWWFKVKVIIFINYKFVKHTVEILFLRTLFWLLISIQIFVIFLNYFVHIETFETWNRFLGLLFVFMFFNCVFLFYLERMDGRCSNTAYAVNGWVLILSKTIAAIWIIKTFSICKNLFH